MKESMVPLVISLIFSVQNTFVDAEIQSSLWLLPGYFINTSICLVGKTLFASLAELELHQYLF